MASHINTLRPGQNGSHSADDMSSAYFNETVWISIKSSLKIVPEGTIKENSIIGSYNGFAPSKRQTIIWSNDDYFTDAYLRNSTSMS